MEPECYDSEEWAFQDRRPILEEDLLRVRLRLSTWKRLRAKSHATGLPISTCVRMLLEKWEKETAE